MCVCVCVCVCVHIRTRRRSISTHGNEYTIYISLTSKCLHLSVQQFSCTYAYLQQFCLYFFTAHTLTLSLLLYNDTLYGGGTPSVTADTALRSMLMPSLPIGNSTEGENEAT